MKLKTLSYSQFKGKPREWVLDEIQLQDTNLLVGKNASGKSKTIAVIRSLGMLLAGEIPPIFLSGEYDATFVSDESTFRYIVKYKDSKVFEESYYRDDKALLMRATEGKGSLWAEKQNDTIEFQTPDSQLAAVARRDSIQHSFFEPLYQWGKSVHYYPFGTQMGKDKIAAFTKDSSNEPEPKNADDVVALFRKGKKLLGDSFVDTVKAGMCEIGYQIEEIGLTPPFSLTITGNFPGELLCLYIKEKGVGAIVDQHDMSQGMFRALSIIIHLTYAEIISHPSCILIDDIGEGLDFERSSSLISLLVSRTNQSKVQLVMTTNDRFIMNKVPLEAWTLLDREGPHIRIHNIKNSKGIFDQFQFTGLNNFDFFSMEFIKQPLEKDA